MAVSGKKSAVDFEALFARSNSRIKLPQGSWSRYLRGEITPQGARNEEVLSLVKRMDSRFPGTADVFQNPLWRLLDFNEWLSPQELKAMYVDMGEADIPEFIDPKCGAPADRLVHHFHFWRPSYSFNERRVRLQRRTGISGVAACLIEARMDYLGQDPASFLVCLKVALSHLQDLEKYSSPKMKSAFLIMRGACAAYARSTLIDDGKNIRSSRHEALAREGSYLWKNWVLDYEDHLYRLPAKARDVLEAWRTEISCHWILPMD